MALYGRRCGFIGKTSLQLNMYFVILKLKRWNGSIIRDLQLRKKKLGIT